MKKLCFYSPPFPNVKSYYEMIDLAAQYKLPAVEGFCFFEFSEPDEDEAKKIKEYADSKNILFPCFSVFVDLAADKENIQKLKKYAHVAKILGSPYLHHTIVGEFEKSERVLPHKEELFKNGIKAVREIYDYSESIGVKTIIEEQGYIFNGVEGFGNFLKAVERNVGVVADFGNIYESADNLYDFLKEFAHLVVHAHIKDVTLSDINYDGKGLESLNGKYMYESEIGKGIVNIEKAVKILKDAGYNGYYGIEYSLNEENPQAMKEIIEFIEKYI